MPRSNRPRRSRRPAAEPVTRPAGVDSTEQWGGSDFIVRRLSGAPGRSYRCPGCDQEVPSASPHVVAWSAYDSAAADRRHWHTACWSARERRQPGVQRSRNAPRH